MAYFSKRAESEVGTEFRWLEKVMQLNAKSTLMLANMLLIQSFKYQTRSFISLTPGLLSDFQVHRATAFRGLKLLEAAGLVTVRRRRGLAPSVSIIDVATMTSGQLTNFSDSEAGETPDSEMDEDGKPTVLPPKH